MSRSTGSHLPQAARTRAEVAALVPWISPRQLEYWIEKGWIIPDGKPAQGRPRTFSEAELKVLRTMARLVRAGFPAAMAAQVARRAVTTADREGEAQVELRGGDLWLVVTGI